MADGLQFHLIVHKTQTEDSTYTHPALIHPHLHSSASAFNNSKCPGQGFRKALCAIAVGTLVVQTSERRSEEQQAAHSIASPCVKGQRQRQIDQQSEIEAEFVHDRSEGNVQREGSRG